TEDGSGDLSERRDGMRKSQWGGLAALCGTLGLVLVAAGPAQSQRPAEKDKQKPITLKSRLVKSTRLSEKNVELFLVKLGPAVADHLRSGEQVELPGLGVFRVVRVPEHRDLVGGRPATIPASNYVEFLPTGNLVDASNAP